jgi:hypothetical protein
MNDCRFLVPSPKHKFISFQEIKPKEDSKRAL